MKKQILRVAIVVDNSNVQAWVYRSIEHILKLDHVEIDCVLLDPPKENAPSLCFIQKLLNNLSIKFFDSDIAGPDYRQRENINNLLSDIPVQNHAEVAVEADVLINYTDHALENQEKLDVTYGVWNHLFNEGSSHRTGYEGFWETFTSRPEIGSSLQVVHPKLTHPCTLQKSYSCTHEASVYGTNNPNYWKSSSFAARGLKNIQHGGKGNEAFFSRLNSKQDSSTRSGHSIQTLAPNSVQYTLLLAKKIFFKITKKRKYLQNFEQWFLLYSLNPATSSDMSSFIKLVPPKDVFWADPHVIYENDRYYIFIEELPFVTDKGYLSVIEMDKKGNYTAPKKILEKDYHLSYPNVFKHQGEYYMIPESFDNFTVELYKCVQFPHQWEFIMNLMEGVQAADTTLHFENGKWWLFTNIMENTGASPHDELFLFYTEDTENDFITTEWIPHSLNPIVSDVKTARPAGKIFTENGKTFRPSQNCSHHYGYGVNINEITLLSETEYKEKLITCIEPDWDKDVIATHSYSKVKGLVVMDGILLRKN